MNDLVVSCNTTLILPAYLIACIPITSLSENMLTVQVYIFCRLYCGTVIRRLTMGICSEKCVVSQFRHCANVLECTYTYQDSVAY